MAAQKLHTRFIELMRLVKHHHAHGGQQLGHTRFTHGQVGKKQVMVDDDHVGRHGLAARLVDVAAAKLRAFGAKAVFSRRGDQGDDGRPFIQARHFAQVARARGLGPLRHLGQRHALCQLMRAQRRIGKTQAVLAKVAGAPFEQRHAHGHAQRRGQLR